ncbi:hypothetical protein GOB92_34095 [Sinorhizobium meliloti]|nr:hypothetical protein [Sinorhizobium meliloti]
MSTLKRCFGSCADWRRCGESVSDGTGVKVWLSTGYTDMRCGFPSLALRVQEVLKHDPLICVG